MSIVSRTALPGRGSTLGSIAPCGRPIESTLDLGLAGHPAEVLVELRLDAGLPDLVAGLVQLRVRVELGCETSPT